MKYYPLSQSVKYYPLSRTLSLSRTLYFAVIANKADTQPTRNRSAVIVTILATININSKAAIAATTDTTELVLKT